MITQKRLKELLSYNKYTGEFVWLVSRGSAKAGSTAKARQSCGFPCIGIDGDQYKASSLAHLYVKGIFNTKPICKDGNVKNLIWDNIND